MCEFRLAREGERRGQQDVRGGFFFLTDGYVRRTDIWTGIFFILFFLPG